MGKRRGQSGRQGQAALRASEPAQPSIPASPATALSAHRLSDLLLPFVVPTLFFILVWTLYPFRHVSEFDPDEGNNVIKALMLGRGHRLYTEIWNDQPPLFTYMLRVWMGAFGWTAQAARVFVLLCSCVLLWTLHRIVRPVWGSGGAVAATLVLATSWYYVALSVSAMLAIPTLMLAMLSVLSLSKFRQRPRAIWMALSGAFLALSLFTKLFALPLVPLIVLSAVYLAWSRRGETDRRGPWLRPFGLWLAVFGATAAMLTVALIPWSEISQLLRPHLDARRQMTGAGWDKAYAEQLRADWVYALLGLAGLVHVMRRREWLSLVPVLWYGLSAAALYRHRPLWYHHYLLLSVPMAWMAAAALGPLLSGDVVRAWRPWRGASSAAALIGLIFTAGMTLVALAQAPSKLRRERDYADIYVRMTPRDDYIAEVMRQFADDTQYVITDRQMLPFMAGLIVPPELSVTSVKRFQSGHLTIERLLEMFEKYKPEQVLLSWRRRIRPDAALQNYLKTHYRLIYTNVPGDLLYLSPALADNAPAALEQALARVPKSEDGWYNWGLHHAAAGRHAEAVVALKRSVDQRPTAKAYDALAQAFERLGKTEDAAEARSRAAQLRR